MSISTDSRHVRQPSPAQPSPAQPSSTRHQREIGVGSFLTAETHYFRLRSNGKLGDWFIGLLVYLHDQKDILQITVLYHVGSPVDEPPWVTAAGRLANLEVILLQKSSSPFLVDMSSPLLSNQRHDMSIFSKCANTHPSTAQKIFSCFFSILGTFRPPKHFLIFLIFFSVYFELIFC